MWKYYQRPDVLWSISLGCWFIFWLFFPSLRLVTVIGLILHIPILIMGIWNLRLRFFCNTYFSASHEKKKIALTFDDGPDPLLTPAILDILNRYNFKATFFVVAQCVKHHPAIAQRIITDGHTIACHDLKHRATDNFRRKTRLIRDIREANSIIASITGKYPRLYRPPVGLSNPHLRSALQQLDMECIGWNRTLRDAGNRFIHRFKNMPKLVHPGSVILLHDILPNMENRELFLKHFNELCSELSHHQLITVGVETLFGIKAYRQIAD